MWLFTKAGWWVDQRGQQGNGRGWVCGRCQTTGNWHSRVECRACGTAKATGSAAAGGGQTAGKSKGGPLLQAGTQESAAAGPLHAEGHRKAAKGGRLDRAAREPTKVEKLLAQLRQMEEDPDAFDEGLFALVRGNLELARA